MAQRRNRFAPPTKPARRRTLRTEIVEPGGINTAEQEINLRPGEAPFSQNFVVEDGWLRPRVQLDALANHIADSDSAIGVIYADDPENALGGDVFVATSSGSVWRNALGNVSWSAASSIDGSIAPGGPGAATTRGEAMMRAVSEEMLLFMTNGAAAGPAKLVVGDFNPNISSLTEAYSLLSRAEFITAFDDRLLFFNVTSDATKFPNRIVWSARGDPLDFENGGFEDLNDMHEIGTGLVAEEDRALLFSKEEVWEARPRRDSFVFDFDRLQDSVGAPYSETIVKTPIGTIWLSHDFMLYALIGNQSVPIGQKAQRFLRDRINPDGDVSTTEIFATYDQASGLYLLFFVDNQVLTLDINTINQDGGPEFGYFTIGEATEGSGNDFTAASKYLSSPTARQPRGWSTAIAGGSADSIRVFSYSHFSNVAGKSNFTAQWRSHAFRSQRESTAYEEFSEFYVHYETDSAATLNISVSTDLGSNFASAGTIELPTGDREAYLPVSVPAARHPMFQMQMTGDASGNRARIGRVEITLRSRSGRRAGAR